MSTLETNAIGKYSGNNVSVDDSLNLKSYTTTQRDALTSVAGDMIYNTTDSKVQVYNGSSWSNLGGIGDSSIEYLVIEGGGAGGAGGYGGGYHGGGGGAGGYIANVTGENSGKLTNAQPLLVFTPGSYEITVGAGAPTGNSNGADGNDSRFGAISSNGGGGGGAGINGNPQPGRDGGCGGGGGSGNASTTSKPAGVGKAGQGFDGGIGTINTTGYAGSGGGAGAVGTGPGGGTIAGGAGIASSITGSSVTRSTGGRVISSGSVGTINSGNGGDGDNTGSNVGHAGGSGIVILKFLSTKSISVGAGLVSATATVGSNTIVSFTAGTGTVTFS